MAEMTAIHFNDYEPQRVYNWYLNINVLGDIIKMTVESVRLPTFGTAVFRMRYFNEDVKIAGAATYEQNQITVRDMVKQQVYSKLNEWMKKVHDPDSGKIGFATEYKEQGTLELAGPDGSVVKSITCKGVWPSMISGNELTYTAEAGEVKLAMVLQVDKYILNF